MSLRVCKLFFYCNQIKKISNAEEIKQIRNKADFEIKLKGVIRYS